MKVAAWILTGLVAWSCGARNVSETPAEVYALETSDPEMDSAMQQARNSFHQFDSAFRSHNPDLSYFAVKLPFENNGGTEHIWLSGIALDQHQYTGVVENIPETITEVSVGDTLPIVPRFISDWMYVDKGVLRGGYTLRLQRARMTEAEREQFDLENGLSFEE